MGFVFNVSGAACYIACPMLTIGEYDVDWKENPLDSKSDIVGIGNILRNSLNLPYGDYWNEGRFLCLSSDDFYHVDDARYTGTITDHLPIPESPYITGKVFVVNAIGNEPAGITQLYNNEVLAEYGQFPKQSALMSLICNSDRVIPVSMSIWCYTPDADDVHIALMPIRVSGMDLFAPATYETLSAGEWRRFTRTIYIPANTSMPLSATNIYLGGALAASHNGAKVYFALPMVTFGSTPSTWFPSAYDIFNEINSVSSSASSALSTAKAAQTTANSAASTASTANTTANTALTTANNKVSKSGDTMTGDLDMNDNSINSVDTIYVNNINTYNDDSDEVTFNSLAHLCSGARLCGGTLDMEEGDITNAAYIYTQQLLPYDGNEFLRIGSAYFPNGFHNGDSKSYASSQLMQGDGNARDITSVVSSTNTIPTAAAVYNAIIYGNFHVVGTSATTTYTWLPTVYTSSHHSSNFYHLIGHTATSLTVTIGSYSYFQNNIQYLLIQQTTNTCNITLSGTDVKTKGNITSFTVAAGQSIEFSCLYVNGYNYVTYTIFG